MAEPTYGLDRVHACARAKQLELDFKRARDELLLVLETIEDCYRFAAAVLLELEPDDFCQPVTLGPPNAGTYDEYGIRISDQLTEEFGVSRCWYLKFKLTETDLSGETVFLVSLHKLNKPMPRKGGRLNPE